MATNPHVDIEDLDSSMKSRDESIALSEEEEKLRLGMESAYNYRPDGSVNVKINKQHTEIIDIHQDNEL